MDLVEAIDEFGVEEDVVDGLHKYLDRKKENILYCVMIEKAYPDYKRPYCITDVEHFRNKDKAEKYIKIEKRKYYNDCCVKEDEDGNYVEINSDEDPSDYDNEAYDMIYADSYMDMSPFGSSIIEVEI